MVSMRNRRDPPMPHTYFGNMAWPAYLEINEKPKSAFEVALKIREAVGQFDDSYCQSRIDYISQNPFTQYNVWLDDTCVMFTNWNKLFDWYGDANLGKGNPVKFMLLCNGLDRCFVILPGARAGETEMQVSMTATHMGRFLEHEHIKKYFTHNY